MNIPTKEECIGILKHNSVPDNIIAHSKKVCGVAVKVANLLDKRKIRINKELVIAGALLHDVKKLSPNDHVVEGYKFIKSLGFPEVAVLIKKHGLANLDKEEFAPITWEEKVVFYADKRVTNDKVVSLDERFKYIKQRYKSENIEQELKFTKNIEKELLGNEKL